MIETVDMTKSRERSL
ncbi:hypothetical protein MPLDJ20_270094 [Mesorhizobium plurifarium]|uniref:Uncharacterized protein n=1 Tax=Mesorhizobium plurifarium TaxID=69974 RepID=A0A090F8R8_MESPL|nr:hypothetical protein MPLDJ20_270094 [Mesorhizobium plurifarium]